jgi:hypothetical protein
MRYEHERTATDGSTEKFKASFMAGTAAAKSLSWSTEDQDYKRTVTIGEISGESDTQNQAAIAESIARGVAQGLR